jgi:iron complex outermembrane receptor protein
MSNRSRPPASHGHRGFTKRARAALDKPVPAKLVVLVAAALLAAGQPAAAAPLQVADIADLSLEQLTQIEVTSVSGRAEPLSGAAASIFVLSNEDIRRSGARTLPEALRLAPNLQVAQTSASTYAISARGFNNSIGNKLLVLIDGRTVYTPLFSGVFWDTPDVMLEDVDRIEIISGPGATLWGANAVNGVINVITRRAEDSQGALASVGSGNRDSSATFRYGGKLGTDGTYRVYGKAFELQNTRTARGAALQDGWERGQVGFRADWGTAKDGYTVQGDAFNGESDARPFGALKVSGMNILGRMNRQTANGGTVRVQAYYDHTEREEPFLYRDAMDIFDLEIQHGLPQQGNHKLLWGGGYRYARDDVQKDVLVAFIPAQKNLYWGNVFVQDEIRLTDRVELTVGAKFESNVYTGVEFLPSARVGWKLAENQLLWGAASRAVRAPARIDREFFLPGNPPYIIRGGPNFVSEVANVFELGYRAQPSSVLSYSVTVFHSVYDKLRSGQPGPNAMVQNMLEGTTNGLETWGTFQATPDWRLSAGVTFLQESFHLKPGSTDPVGAPNLGNDPKHQWNLRSAHKLSDKVDFDLMVRHVATLSSPVVPQYTAVDARLGWRVRRDLELSVTGRNLLDPTHPEFDALATRSELARSVFVNLLWRQ